MDNLWQKVENIVAKGEMLVLSNFFLCHYVFEKSSAAEASIWAKGLIKGTMRKVKLESYFWKKCSIYLYKYKILMSITPLSAVHALCQPIGRGVDKI